MKNLMFVLRLLLVILPLGLIATEPKIIHLIPSTLSDATISEKIVCTRPMRDGKFNISLEHKLGKVIVNCYGHGGSGWTTLFGSVSKAIELFQSIHPSLSTQIRVIGSGCMGLATAIELDNLGFHVVGVSTKSLYDMPFWRAAGYFALVSVKTSPEEQKSLNEIGLTIFFDLSSYWPRKPSLHQQRSSKIHACLLQRGHGIWS